MKNKEFYKPTEVQLKHFAQHIANCHSWYKHLPLLTGGSFIVFLDMNAGDSYPALHPKLPFGNSSDKYMEAFGCLSYCYKTNHKGSWQSDNNTLFKTCLEVDHLELPSYILDRCSFILYPFISDDFSEAYNYHESGFNRIRDGQYHPYAAQLLEWEKLHQKKEQLWDNLTEEEMENIISIGHCSVNMDNMNDFINVEREESRLLRQIRFEEFKKITRALKNLKEYYT